MDIEEIRKLQADAKQKRVDYINSVPQRNLDIIKLRLVDGLTLQDIATRYGLTRQRVKQIVDKPV